MRLPCNNNPIGMEFMKFSNSQINSFTETLKLFDSVCLVDVVELIASARNDVHIRNGSFKSFGRLAGTTLQRRTHHMSGMHESLIEFVSKK